MITWKVIYFAGLFRLLLLIRFWIVNWIVNNSFTGFYEPTVLPDLYRFAYNLNEEDPDLDPIFFDIEIVDLFPHDHPFIEIEAELADEAQAEM